jgi:hypothetical protein
MIIDDALAHKGGTKFIDRKIVDRLFPLKISAKRFVFSPEASQTIGRFAFECGDIIVNNRQFAKRPYEQMYIEFDAKAFFKDFRDQGLLYSQQKAAAASKKLNEDQEDSRIGYLLDGDKIYSFAERSITDGLPPQIMLPLLFKLVAPGEHAGRDSAPLDLSRYREPVADKQSLLEWFRLGTAYGTTMHSISSEEQRLQMLDQVSFHWIGAAPMQPPLMTEILRNHSGEMRNVLALLLWLNQPSRIHLVNEPLRSRISRGKRVVYNQHHVVTLKLGPKVTVRSALRFEDRASPIRHEVRGFWQHYGGNKNCTHAWTAFPDENGHFVCQKCSRLRYWIKEFVRGDATKGFATSEYAVKVEGETSKNNR